MRTLTMLMLLSTVSAWADIAPPRQRPMPPPRSNDACVSDNDCVLAPPRQCCGGCCPQEVQAMSRAEVQRQRDICARADCAVPACTPFCPPVEPADHFVAQCRNHQCVRMPKPRPPTYDDKSCQVSDECTTTTWTCCDRGCCGRNTEEYAVNKRALAQLQRSCNHAMCPRLDCAAAGACAEPPLRMPSTAACVNERCTLVPVNHPTPPPPHAECRQNSECRIVYPQAVCTEGCGCCSSSTPVAVPVGRSIDRDEPTGGSKKRAAGEAEFGLHPGHVTSCPPCPPPRPATAVCQMGACVVAPERVRLVK